MTAAPLPLEVPPGVVRSNSPNAAKGRFTNTQFCRFIDGFPEKWGGWVKYIDEQLQGVPRGSTSWTSRFGNRNIAVGTNSKLYAITAASGLKDITPIRLSETINENPFATVEDSSIVTVTHTSHGAESGDFVIYSGADPVGGLTIDGEYQIVSKIDLNTYTIDVGVEATSTSTATGGGSVVVAEYQIISGPASAVAGLGYGAGPYGEGAYGTERTEGIPLALRQWSINEYGNDIIASPSGGGLYLWNETTDERAQVVANAPTSMQAMFVTGERFIMALGTITPMTIQWPDRDDMTDWIPGSGDTANQRVLQYGSKLVNGTPLTDGVSLVWSDSALYIFQFTGTDFIYDNRHVGDGCGLIAPKAFATAKGVAYWMSGQRFMMYGNGVSDIQNLEDIREFVFEDMDRDQMDKTWAIYDQKYNQVRWHYCSNGSIEPNKYVDVNLTDWSWTTGPYDEEDFYRSTGCSYNNADGTLIEFSPDGFVYQHNRGLDADGVPLHSFYTYGFYALTRGDSNVDIVGVIPDHKRHVGPIHYAVQTYERPDIVTMVDEVDISFAPGVGIDDYRVEGRHFTCTVTSNSMGGDYRTGILSLEIAEAGKRR